MNFKYLLVFILEIILAIVTPTISMFAQPKGNNGQHKTDSLLIDHYIYKLNKEIDADSSVVRSDSGEPRTSYTEGSVTYSPDKKFKLFVISGEACGSICNNIYKSYLYLIPSNTPKVLSDNIEPIEAVYKLDNNKYLIIQRSSRTNGHDVFDTKQATLLSIKNNKIAYHAINYDHPVDGKVDPKYNKDLSLNLYETLEDENDENIFFLRYDPQTKRLRYRYRINFEECCHKDEAYIYSGYFVYENGSFIHKKED